ncbi:MAG: c-type cytochrome [Alphaproteobacteria bacterium]|nr:c-type cytochrome [Alphaproteobacteria bacterium]
MRHLTQIRWRLACGLVAAAICAAPTLAEDTPLSKRIKDCAPCHGPDGNSRTATIPSLAGQPKFFILDQLIFIREGVRPVEAMAPFVKTLKEDEIVALAEHYAALPPKSSDENVDPALVVRGAALALRLRCASCHLPSLVGQEQIPRLAKQRIDYMNEVMKAYRDGRRKGGDSIMAATVFGISDADILALAHYAASR